MPSILKHIPAAVLLSLLLSCGCGKQAASGEYRPESIYVARTELSMQPGDKVQLVAKPVPSIAGTLAFSWESSDNTVATVSDGLVEAVSEGNATVTVSYLNLSTRVEVSVSAEKSTGAVLYNTKLDSDNKPDDVLLNGAASYNADGLLVNKTAGLVKLNRFYALGERLVRYRIVPSDDAVCIFQAEDGDFQVTLDIPGKKVSILTSPVTSREVEFLAGGREFDVEVQHIYQNAVVRVVDVQSGREASLSATNDGRGGCGKGAVGPGFYVGPGWDYYCFGLREGSSMLVERITVESFKDKVKLLIYGDSISQPECYYPTADFPEAYTQLLIAGLGGSAMSSGRGGCTIATVSNFIRNELPYIKADYVMVTIGTNGGNTDENLTALMQYIRDCGSIPILNNMPCNESGSQNREDFGGNPVISRVREKLGIKGALLDRATSLAGDGKEVDKSMMYWEDYTDYPAPMTGWQIYHHPNPKGGRAMYEQIRKDVPEIFN